MVTLDHLFFISRGPIKQKRELLVNETTFRQGLILLRSCVDPRYFDNPREEMRGEEARAELPCGLRTSAIDQLVQNVVLNMILLSVIVQFGFFLGYLYASGTIDFDLSSGLLGSLMRELLDVKNGERFS